MYLTILAEQLDVLVAQAGAHINEDHECVVVSNLSATSTLKVLDLCEQLGWECSAFDEEHSHTEKVNIIDEFAPFRITIRKPESNEGVLDILTFAGFSHYLEKGHDATSWRIAGINKSLVTYARTYTDWSSCDVVTVSFKTKSPRALVRDSGFYQSVPIDIRPWLIVDIFQLDFEDAFHKLWCMKAFDALMRSLASEIDPETSALIFKGPPKLILQAPEITEARIDSFGQNSFSDLQVGAFWVYENSRETELKHNLLSMEIARSGRENGEALEYFKANFSTALESAKIAYQMSLSELGKDTLKSLADLRKAITEETAKATDATRQTITAVSGSLTVCIGLMAARLTTEINPWLVSAVMLVAVGYIGMIVYSGWSFISLQRELRKDWQPKLYRFLPQYEYQKMVTIPAEKAETVFKCSALIGTAAVIILCVGVSVFSFLIKPKAAAPEVVHSESKKAGHDGSSTAYGDRLLLETRLVSPSHFAFQKKWFSPLIIPNTMRPTDSFPAHEPILDTEIK